jgi:hypothetical protein
MRSRVLSMLAGLLLVLAVNVPIAAAGTVPPIPTGVGVSVISSSSINIYWSEGTSLYGLTSFTVTDSISYINVSSSARSYTWSGLPAGTWKCFFVRANNLYGSSGWSSQACAYTLPATPGISAYASGAYSIYVSWSIGISPSGFELSDGLTSVYPGSSTRSYYWSVAPATYKCFHVRARNNSGYGGWSGWACATTPPLPPATPAGLTAVAQGQTSVLFSWTENSNQTGFEVNDGSTTYSVGAGTRSFSWGSLQPSQQKCARVRAYNSGGYSGYTGYVCATTWPPVPATPTGVTATAVSSSQITITWSENSTQAGFDVLTGSSSARIADPNARSYTWGGLAPKTTYCFQVRAYNISGASGYSSSVCATTSAAILSMIWYTQFQSANGDNAAVDCGPTSVAMALQYYGKRTANETDAQWIAEVRSKTGAPDGDGTDIFQLQNAAAAYGVGSSIVVGNRADPAPGLAAIKSAWASGKPVIAFVHCTTWGITSGCSDHWVVILGFSADGNSVYVNDPAASRGLTSKLTTTLTQAMVDSVSTNWALILG